MKTTKNVLKFLIGVLGFSSMMVSCHKDDDSIQPMYGVTPVEYKAKPDVMLPVEAQELQNVNNEESSK